LARTPLPDVVAGKCREENHKPTLETRSRARLQQKPPDLDKPRISGVGCASSSAHAMFSAEPASPAPARRLLCENLDAPVSYPGHDISRLS
jgi:hypothetical protein